MARHIIFIHGRGKKPPKESLSELYVDALKAGVSRDFLETSDEYIGFETTKKSMVYYGDKSNDLTIEKFDEDWKEDFQEEYLELLEDFQEEYLELLEDFTKRKFKKSYSGITKIHTEPTLTDLRNYLLSELKNTFDNTESRRKTLTYLKQFEEADFTIEKLKSLDGIKKAKKAFKKMNMLGIFARLFDFDDDIIKSKADMKQYWKRDSDYASDIITKLKDNIKAIAADDPDHSIAIIAHSLGTIVTYETLLDISRLEESEIKIDLLITLGSPLGDGTFKKYTRKAFRNDFDIQHDREPDEDEGEHLPDNIVRWANFSAYYDFVSHDTDLVDDYKDLIKEGIIRKENFIDIERLENLSVRRITGFHPDGKIKFDPDKVKVSPHHISGYLIHPKVSKLVGNWCAGYFDGSDSNTLKTLLS